MPQWPKLKHVVAVWAALTSAAFCAYVLYLHRLPPDDLVMAGTLSFQATVALIVVGLPSLLLLFLFLLIGAIAKHWLYEPPTHCAGDEDAL